MKLTIEQQGKGLIKVNGQPLSLVQPEILRFKVCFRTTRDASHRIEGFEDARQFFITMRL